MTSSLDAALSGMLQQQRRIELVANNIANVNTTGYKRVAVQFQGALDAVQILGAVDVAALVGEATTSSGVGSDAVERVFAQGMLQPSPDPLDLAIVGAGFFRLRLEDGTIAYARDGSFRLDGDGRLVTQLGAPLEPPLTFPAAFHEVRVLRGGEVVVRRSHTEAELAALGADEPRTGVDEVLGRIELTRFANPAGLASIGGSLYVATDDLYVATDDSPPTDGFPDGDGIGYVAGGFLEASNVELAQEMTSLMIASRMYQMNLAAYRTIQEMLEQAHQLLA